MGVVLGNGSVLGSWGTPMILCWSATPCRVCYVSWIVFISGIPWWACWLAMSEKVMVFRAVGLPAQPFVCSGHPLECVVSYKYLGCVSTDPSGMGGTLGQSEHKHVACVCHTLPSVWVFEMCAGTWPFPRPFQRLCDVQCVLWE